MKQFTHYLNEIATGKKALVLFILTNVVYLIMLLATIPMTMDYSNGMKLLDMMPAGYNATYVTDLFQTLGEDGRWIYLTRQIPLDLIYPFLFGFSYCLIMAYFLKKLNKLKTPFTYLCLLPVLAGLADYLENFGIITMLFTFPDFPDILATTTGVFSIAKSVFTTLFFVSLIIILIFFGFRIYGDKRSHRNEKKKVTPANF